MHKSLLWGSHLLLEQTSKLDALPFPMAFQGVLVYKYWLERELPIQLCINIILLIIIGVGL